MQYKQTNIQIIKVLNRLLDKELKDNNAIKAILKVSHELKQDIHNLDNRLEKYQQKIKNRQDVESKELWKAVRAIQRKIMGI